MIKYLYFRLKRFFLVGLVYVVDKKLGIRIPPIPSASAIIRNKNKILVIKLTYKSGYGLPGGVLQKNETFEEGVRREVFEETGLTISSLEYFGSYEYNHEYPSVNITYLVKIKGNLRDSKEGKPEWIEPKEIVDQLVFEDNREAVKKFLKMKSKIE